jgi:hypothetical protein
LSIFLNQPSRPTTDCLRCPSAALRNVSSAVSNKSTAPNLPDFQAERQGFRLNRCAQANAGEVNGATVSRLTPSASIAVPDVSPPPMTRQPTPSLTSPERRRPTLSRPVGPRPHAPIWAARPRSPPGRSTSRRTLGRRRDAQPPIGGRCGPPPPPASDLRGRSGGQDASPRSMRSARPFVPSNCQKARRRTRRCSETAAENRPRAIRANAVSRAYSAPPRCLLSASRREAALSQARRPPLWERADRGERVV